METYPEDTILSQTSGSLKIYGILILSSYLCEIVLHKTIYMILTIMFLINAENDGSSRSQFENKRKRPIGCTAFSTTDGLFSNFENENIDSETVLERPVLFTAAEKTHRQVNSTPEPTCNGKTTVRGNFFLLHTIYY